jgi:UDP-N-acetylmuramoyl-tripeptide--D-alanyl-D-alanine ligase
VYEYLVRGGVAVVNADDARAMSQLSRAKDATVRTFGAAGEYSVRERVLTDAGGIRCTLALPNRTLDVALPFLGPAQLTDLTCALACFEAHFGEITTNELETAMAGLTLEGRATTHTLGSGLLLIDDTYNANPESMRAALGLLVELAATRRKIAVVGDMRELGTYSVRAHTELGHELVTAGVGLVIGCGTEIAHTLEITRAAGIETLLAQDAEHAGNLALGRSSGTDVVLLKASRGIGLDRAVKVLVQASS